MHADPDKQGLVQGMVTGMRGLCTGMGPAMFGVIFYLFHVDLKEDKDEVPNGQNHTSRPMDVVTELVPGPPFVFGALLVILAIIVAAFIPETGKSSFNTSDSEDRVARIRRIKKEEM
jgi:hypothetical protein